MKASTYMVGNKTYNSGYTGGKLYKGKPRQKCLVWKTKQLLKSGFLYTMSLSRSHSGSYMNVSSQTEGSYTFGFFMPENKSKHYFTFYPKRIK